MKDLTGLKFHHLTALAVDPVRNSSGKVRWVCQCDCGNQTVVVGQHLTNGNTKSCGCRRVEAAKKLGRLSTHGMTGSPEYKAWQSMKDRCYNEDCHNYHLYGGRGILVWADWLKSFEAFYNDLGPRPSNKHSLDRIDVNGHYRPDNCRWATAEEQSNNRRNTTKYTIDGVSKSAWQWAREYDIPVTTLVSRLIRDNLPIEEAVRKIPSKQVYTHGDVTKRLNEWAVELNVTYSKLYSLAVTKKIPFDQIINSFKGA